MSVPRQQDSADSSGSPSRLNLVLHDVHFWVPVVVLIGGLLVLQWIQ